MLGIVDEAILRFAGEEYLLIYILLYLIIQQKINYKISNNASITALDFPFSFFGYQTNA